MADIRQVLWTTGANFRVLRELIVIAGHVVNDKNIFAKYTTG